jgi:hypothetical protein
MNFDNLKFCNCSNCGRECLGKSVKKNDIPEHLVDMPKIEGHIHGRPWCNICLKIPSCGVSGICGGTSGPEDQDIGSYRTIAVRCLEEG